MVWLCAWLCQYKKLDCQKDIITHTDVVGKNYKLCPIYMVKNPDKMQQFKQDCQNLKEGKIRVSDITNCTAEGSSKIPKMIKVIQNVNYRTEPNFKKTSIAGEAIPGQIFTVVDLIQKSTTNMYKLKSGFYITASPKYVEEFIPK